MGSKVNGQRAAQLVLGTRWCWWRNNIFGVREKPKLTVLCDLRAQVRLVEKWVVKVWHCTQKLLPVICIFEFLAESIMYQMGCDITVSCPDQATHMLVCWGKSPVVSSSKQGENVPWVIWTDDESWIETVYSYVTARLVHFPPRCVNLKKISLPSCFGQVKVFLYQIMTFPVLLKLIERCWTIEESNCWKSKKQPLCGRLWDQGWYNITKVSGLFPCPFLTLIFLSMVDPFSVSWTRPPETLDIFSFS